MASRRTRIKGLVANIPQRRKVISKDEDPVLPKIEAVAESHTENTNTNNKSEVFGNCLENNVGLLSETKSCSENATNGNGEYNNTHKGNFNEYMENSCEYSNTKVTTIEEPCDTKDASFINNTDLVTSQDVSIDDTNNILTQGNRKEPHVIAVIINNQYRDNNIKSINQVILPSVKNVEETSKNCDPKSTTGCEMTLNEVNLVGNKTASSISSVPGEKRPTKLFPENTSWGFYSDKDYPPPPPSPSKFSRSRIKAVPRFSQRKTSFSASESEDESRRHSRIRNDSVSSITGGNTSETISEAMSPYQKTQKDSHKVIQKKVNRTEQYRKLAEARREFHKRFGCQNPDKQRLKMIDLIFYNPTTNPMSKRIPKESENEKSENIEDKVEEPENPKIDVVSKKEEKEKKSDEENEMPVPQIKIGPTGEIILDEQSLVIERKEITQAKEDMQKSSLVDGDFDTGYGIYKRVKRSKDWSQQETLRFYKALNVIGTDFSLMCELFPKRTRRELKMKFKKEEKLNQHLIDRAVMDPCKFDYAELKEEVELQEKEMAEIQKIKEEEAKKNKEKKTESAAARKRKLTLRLEKSDQERAKSMMQETSGNNDYIPLKKVKKPKRLTIESILSDSDADESDVNTHSSSESEGEVIVPLKPTRSGRVPKNMLKLREVEKNERATTITNIMKKTRTLSNCSNISTTSTDHLIPGSIMIVPEEDGNPENTSYKIYMVTPDKTLTPLEVDSDTVSKAIKFKENEEKSKSNTTEEINLTIPASDTVMEAYSENNGTEHISEENNVVFEYVDVSSSEHLETKCAESSTNKIIETGTVIINETPERTTVLPAKVRDKLHRNALD